MMIIPAIDIYEGKCVRLTQGDYQRVKTYSNDPVEVARAFEEKGIQKVHIVDLMGAREGHFTISEILSSITRETQLEVQVGGGLKSLDDVNAALQAGAVRVILGTIAARSPQTVTDWLSRYDAQQFILGADAYQGKIMVNGWTEDSGLDVFEFIRGYSQVGIRNVICTDISVDGTLAGPSLTLYESIMTRCPGIQLIASGGVRDMADVQSLKSIGIERVVVGKALYEGRISLSEIAETC